MKILDVGCGLKTKKEGAIGLDIRKSPNVDVVHDLDLFPYPFNDNEFDYIEMSHIIEHVRKPLDVMNEIYRISKEGAQIRVITPHYTSQLSYGDMEHFHRFGYITFKTLQDSGCFRIKKHKLHFIDFYKVFGISLLANLFLRRWEKYLSFIFPAMYIEVFLEVINKGEGGDLKGRYVY
ncbi:MAG TPA: class I SAM-dependent methyltransferase [bacterium]|nr:class I SAM-dependent methyltransferase [bacterium]